MESPRTLESSVSKPEERRKFPRLRREERVVLRRIEAGDDDPERNVLYCKTVDISPTGLQARARQELHRGEPVDVVVNVEGYGDSFHLRGETRWCRPVPGADEYLLGVEIVAAEGSDILYWRRIFN